MEILKEQLEENQKALEAKQNEYLQNIQSQKQSLDSNVEEIDKALENLDDTVKNTQIVFLGDSVMLGASFKLDEYFNNYYCDAAGNRNCSESVAILQTLIDRNLVGDFVVIHLGTNWGLSQQNLDDMNAVLNGQKIFWLTLTNSWGKNDNPMLIEYCENHENNYCIDWNAYSKGRDELFIGDGIHLSDEGQEVYDKYIFDYLADVIKQELNIKKENLLNSYNNQYNNNISFYGNDILLNIYNNLNQNYKFFPNSDYDFTSLYKQLSNDKDNLNLSKTI